tara:strand:- start:352 stop:651 length:300 start_codon:yes stop_codon:yes gene_type:complete
METDVYEIGDLVYVVDNWWENIDTQQIPAPLPLFEAQRQEKLCGIIVDREIYPGALGDIDRKINTYKMKHSGLYHVLLSNGKIKKYFHNRLDRPCSEET